MVIADFLQRQSREEDVQLDPTVLQLNDRDEGFLHSMELGDVLILFQALEKGAEEVTPFDVSGGDAEGIDIGAPSVDPQPI